MENKNCVIYARYSSHAQNDASIEQQLDDCKQYAEQHELNIIGVYADRAISGTSDKRPEFQRMVRDSAKRRFQYVIVWKVDRFARNRYDSATYKVRLRNNGVKLLYAKESIPDGPEGILLESILEGSAEYYSANLAQNVKRGMNDLARQGKIAGGVMPFGYQRGEDGRFAIQPDEAEIVRMAFHMYADGMPTKQICDTLNSQGYRNRNGKPFTKNSFRTIFRSERYTGVYTYGDIRIEGAMPAIISRDIFDQVQKILNQRMRAPATGRDVNYLLTGKLYCGKCRDAMVGESGTSHTGAIYYYYKCRTRKRSGSCDMKPVKKDEIERMVANVTRKRVLNDTMIDRIAKAAIKIQSQEDRDNSKANILSGQLKSIESKIQNLMDAIEAGIITSTTKSRLMELEEQRTQLMRSIEKEKLENPVVTYEDIVYWLQKVKATATEEKLIDLFVQRIYLYDDHFEVYYQHIEGNPICKYNYTGSDLAHESPLSNAKSNHAWISSRYLRMVFYIL